MSRKERLITPGLASVPDIDVAVDATKGGTGGRSPLQAADALEVLSKYRLGQPGGIARLNSNAMIDASGLGNAIVTSATIKGPKEVYAEQVVEYVITNYDSNIVYMINVSVGSFVRNEQIITYTAPSNAGTLELLINGRSIGIPILPSAPITPSILSPVDNSSNQPYSITLTASNFTVPAGTPNHEFSDWEIATDSSFSNVVRSSYADTVNKTSWAVTGLSKDTQYYRRVRYKDVTKGYSAWSVTGTFRTRNSNLPLYETALLRPYRDSNDDGGTIRFGDSVYSTNRSFSLSADGSRVAVCDSDIGVSGSSVAGLLYVFRRENGTWIEELRIPSPVDNTGTGTRWATAVDLDATATRMVVATGYNAFVYVRSGTTWTKEAKLANPSGTASLLFGFNVVIDSTGLRVAVTCGSARRCYVFLRTGTTWSQEAFISPPAQHTQYGSNTDWLTADFDENANRLILGNPYYDGAYFDGAGQASLNSGIVHIYSRSGTTWTRDHWFLPPAQYDSFGPISTEFNQRNSGALFGNGVVMSNDGNRVAVGFAIAGQDVEGSNNQPFPVLIYRRDGLTNWVVEAALTTPGVVSSVSGIGLQGVEFDMTADGSGAILSHYRYENNAYVGPFLSMFEKNGSTWEYSHTATPSYFGAILARVGVRLSGDGKFALMSLQGQSVKRISVFS